MNTEVIYRCTAVFLCPVKRLRTKICWKLFLAIIQSAMQEMLKLSIATFQPQSKRLFTKNVNQEMLKLQLFLTIIQIVNQDMVKLSTVKFQQYSFIFIILFYIVVILHGSQQYVARGKGARSRGPQQLSAGCWKTSTDMAGKHFISQTLNAADSCFTAAIR